jgi:hypothetical protein
VTASTYFNSVQGFPTAKPTQTLAPLLQGVAAKQTPHHTTWAEPREIEESEGKRVLTEQSRRFRRRRVLLGMASLRHEFEGERARGERTASVTGSVSAPFGIQFDFSGTE